MHYMVLFTGSAGRIRTCDQSITRILSFPKRVDYIIALFLGNVGREALPVTFATVLPEGIVSEPSI